MRRLVLASPLFLAACVARQPQPEPQPAPSAVTQPEARKLLGESPQQLVALFGNPAFQVREGNSLKLQFKSRRCVLDAYFYPSSAGDMRVTWIDARLPSGADADQAACISDLENPS